MKGEGPILEKLCRLGSAALILSATVLTTATGDAASKVTKASGERFLTIDGSVLYQEMCASCHGDSGRGNGPAADRLTVRPVDLTVLSMNNGGSFPSTRVLGRLNGTCDAGIEERQMPRWDQVLGGEYRDLVGARLRIHNLVQYLKTIQRKAVESE